MDEKEKPKKMFSSKVSIVGLFAMLTFILTIPLAVLLSQQQQTLQQHAAEQPTLPPLIPTVVIHNQTPGYIAGYVYNDTNQSGERDAGELSFPDVTVKVTAIDKNTLSPAPGKTSQTTTLKTDSNGYFKFPLQGASNELQSYLVQVVLPASYKTINTNPLLLVDISPDVQKTVGFGLFTLKPIRVTPSSVPATRSALPTQAQAKLQ